MRSPYAGEGGIRHPLRCQRVGWVERSETIPRAAILHGRWVSRGATHPTRYVLHYGVVLREERYLERKFGEDYRRFKAEMPRYGWRL
jgi:protein-S-isoprenylcysteine O-methyltransferase Ste14